MDTQLLVLTIFGILLVAIAIEPLASRFKLPLSAVLVLVGFIGSEIIVGLGYDTGLRWWHFHDLIFHVFLPVLIFESAFQLDARLLRRNLFPILVLAIPLMILSAGLTAVIVYWAIGHPQGFPWIAALITGALLSATDPAAVLDLFKRFGVPERLHILVDGESLFNDATAIVLFNILVAIALSGSNNVGVDTAALRFVVVFLGGAAVGVAVGAVAMFLFRLLKGSAQRTVLSLAAAYGAFYSSEALGGVSGVMAVLMVGLMLGSARLTLAKQEDMSAVESVWSFNAYIANSLLFVLSGVTITVVMFTDQWLSMLIGIAAAVVARAVGIFGVVPALGMLPRAEPISLGYQTVMWWGGVRGAVTLALGLSLPAELPYAFTIQSIAYGVVIFTLFVQAPTVSPLLDRFRLSHD